MKLKYTVWDIDGTRLAVPHIAWAWLGLALLQGKGREVKYASGYDKELDRKPVIEYDAAERAKAVALVAEAKLDAEEFKNHFLI